MITRWRRSLAAARANLGRSVAALAPGADATDPGNEVLRLGIKDTPAIGDELRRRLAAEPGLAWLTVDRAAPGGRAVDTGLLNPLTGRPMTGSTSGGPVNILLGIIDLCVGTDGGGSVLGPAAATGLAGIIGSGLGLTCPVERVSTDGFAFRPALGVIARDWPTARTGFRALLRASGAAEPPAAPLAGLRVALPRPGSVTLPDGADMAAELEPYLRPLWAAGAEPVAVDMTGIAARERAMALLREIWATADLAVTLEGPVDLFGLGDSVVGSLGPPGAALQARGGKYLLRALNLVGCTGIALPVPRLSSGLILAGPPGPVGAARALAAADLLAPSLRMPPLFERYFFQLP
ncbi:hypothetical protein [Symbiobacterium thermophilum]|uniref:Amidase n=1 Tax=Symbiobacterium thermophilum TaxID=2734 RepID=A0A953LKW4_SYMTR|nr:hypothetical protein [Symbiobacterium thermophilum]MBY6277477.1 hypothetical protein [Symbiobacterium thermophilum]